MVHFKVFGCVGDINTFYSESLTKKIIDRLDDGSTIEFKTFLEVDYWLALDDMRNNDGLHSLMHYQQTHLILRNKEILGDIQGLLKAAMSEYSIEDAEVVNTVVFNRLVRETSYHAFKAFKNPLLTIQFLIINGPRETDMEDMGVVTIELLENFCPNACENFMRLCEGYRLENGTVLKYRNCPIHRIVKNGWFQTGDVVDGTGKNSTAVVDPSGQFPDESYSADFGFARGGMFGYANEGAHTNRSQFFVTLGPCAWMNNKFVGFARVIQGFNILREINNIPTSNQCPTKTIKIGLCGRPAELVPPTGGGSI